MSDLITWIISRVPRRRWAIKTTITNRRGEGTSEVDPRRYWTRGGAQLIADEDRAMYDEADVGPYITVEVVHAGPFNRAAYEADIDRQLAALRRPRPPKPGV